MTVTVRPVAEAGEVCGLFHAYRAHYGHDGPVTATHAWLREQLAEGRLRIAVATTDGRAAGFVTTAVVPASLTLRAFWLVRDLYVAPEHRCGGVGAALIRHVVDAAREEGALRLSLQTETGNIAALALYEAAGFEPVAGLESLALTLEP
jgi:GNAT superfamily N-acetyltransferase